MNAYPKEFKVTAWTKPLIPRAEYDEDKHSEYKWEKIMIEPVTRDKVEKAISETALRRFVLVDFKVEQIN